MNKDQIIYRTATGIVCAVMLFSALNFSMGEPFSPAMYKPNGAFAHLGLPEYFKIELTIAKLFGVLALVLPGVPIKIREFAYAGFAITLVSASIAHASVGDPLLFIIDPLLFLGALGVSYRYFYKRSHPPVTSAA
jgi:hypothetical protein